MKRARFLVLTLVVAFMLMGAGYAAWTDKLNIQEVVIDSAILDVDFVPYGESGDVRVTTNEPTRAVQVMTAEGRIEAWTGTGFPAELDGEDQDKVRIDIHKIYPGGVVTANFAMENVGTMPVKISEVIIEKTPVDSTGTTPAELNYLPEWLRITGTIGANPIAITTTDPASPNAAWFLGTDREIAPGEVINCELVFALDVNAPNETTEGKSFTLTIHPFFKQFNL